MAENQHLQDSLTWNFNWLNGGDNRSREEHATVAEVELKVDGIDVCNHRISHEQTSSNSICISLYPVTEYLVEHWWKILGNRSNRTSLIEGRSGYAFPDLSICCNGEAIEFLVKPCTYDNPPVRFSAEERVIVPTVDGTRLLSTWIDEVVLRLTDMQVSTTELEKQWKRVKRSSIHDEERQFCLAAGALGANPYAIDDAQSHLIAQMSELSTGERLLELLSEIDGTSGSS